MACLLTPLSPYSLPLPLGHGSCPQESLPLLYPKPFQPRGWAFLPPASDSCIIQPFCSCPFLVSLLVLGSSLGLLALSLPLSIFSSLTTIPLSVMVLFSLDWPKHLWLCLSSYLQERPSAQPYLGAAMSSFFVKPPTLFLCFGSLGFLASSLGPNPGVIAEP